MKINDNEIEDYYWNKYQRKDLEQLSDSELEEVLLEWNISDLVDFLSKERYNEFRQEIVDEIVLNRLLR